MVIDSDLSWQGTFRDVQFSLDAVDLLHSSFVYQPIGWRVTLGGIPLKSEGCREVESNERQTMLTPVFCQTRSMTNYYLD